MSTLASIVLLLRFIDLHRGNTAGGQGAGNGARRVRYDFIDRIFSRRVVPRGAGGRPRGGQRAAGLGVGGGGVPAVVIAAVRGAGGQ